MAPGRAVWRIPLITVGVAVAFHFAVHVPHGEYHPREETADSRDAKKRSTRERKVFDSERVDRRFVESHEPALRRAYQVGFEAANSGAATPEISDVDYECRTMRCRLRVCGDKVGVNMVLRAVNRVQHRGVRLWRVFERGAREPQLAGNAVCVDTIVRFAMRAPDPTELRAAP